MKTKLIALSIICLLLVFVGSTVAQQNVSQPQVQEDPQARLHLTTQLCDLQLDALTRALLQAQSENAALRKKLAESTPKKEESK